MNPAKYNRRIHILQPVRGEDNEGIPVITWAPIICLWAAVKPLRGREYFQAAAINQENTLRVEIRYRTGITSEMRVQYAGKLYNINAILDPDEAHRELHLMCLEVQEHGGDEAGGHG
ncbi:phage head-tail adaptor, putative [Paenibacillus mucilaginosus 3016]|uniref:Phage head-tail adaptor, putative n=1 Tax=Paenibacillus mucilaginosus 3016 TaxID=1116391 RepID=H6NGV1_9BACL|nr:phage head closure protein [Paenibacillus mucilaginosus]AFC28393.1 phage head-tail adaptor, putative [Paenibacillus mucilaginosus 3016]WFA17192.1 head-tail adaptor protein [Paenibacillus mucilaginosus]